MRRLSISLAWEQTKGFLASDGRLLATVAAALIALPLAVSQVILPGGFTVDTAAEAWPAVLVFFVVLSLLLGQLAMVRLAIGPSVSVGEAIAHALRRLPFYFLSMLLIGVAFFVVIIVAVLAAGVPINQGQVPASPAAWLAIVALIAIYCFVWARIVAMSAPVASAEAVGPINIILRSWQLSAGQFWRLLGFGFLYFVGAGIALVAIQFVSTVLATLLFGAMDPLSLTALFVALIDAIANAIVFTILTVMLARIYVQLSGRGSIDVSVPSSGT